MVQIVTISATTAAYAAEALRPSARVSGVSPSEKTVQALAADARRNGDSEQKAMLNVVAPPALALFFLTAEKQPDNTLLRAEQEYLQDVEEPGVVDEARAGDEDAPEEPDSEA